MTEPAHAAHQASSYASSVARSQALGADLALHPERYRILTGDRPTGRLHIGHYFGTLENRVVLQNKGVPLFVLIADYQALTDRDATSTLPADVLEILADYLACGIDPGKATIFCHSHVAALNQLMLPFLSLVTVSEISRNPTVKDEIRSSGRDYVTGMMFTYPVHQAADILSMHGTVVPVGKDQLHHLELTRTIARRFNERYSPDAPYFIEPTGLLGNAPLLLGVDGEKMSKSRRNAIQIASTPDETAKLLKGAKTDPDRNITYDPKHRKEVANLVLLASLCLDSTPEAVAEEIGDGGASALKALVTDAVNTYFQPIRERRSQLIADPAQLVAILREGNERACEVADATLRDVQQLMFTKYY